MHGGRYQWDMQATVLRVAASMRTRSFYVWMDTEMMTGSTLDAMAAAVEDAYCVLICITERYKVRMRTPSPAMPNIVLLPKHFALTVRIGTCVQASANCRLEGTCASC